MVVDEPDALLRIRNASDIIIQNCTFTKSGGTGVRVDRYGQNILIANNKLSYLGRNAIGLAGRGPGYGDVKLQGKSKSTIDAYSRAVRRIKDHYDCCPDKLTKEQLENYFEK